MPSGVTASCSKGAQAFGRASVKACCMSSASTVSLSPHPKLWEKKNPWIAGLLAFLIPGAGHFYQGRTVKGMIYLFSILGLFIWGQRMGEGMVVSGEIKMVPVSVPILKTLYVPKSITPFGYVAQLGVGSLALPAAIQHVRAGQDMGPLKKLSGPLTEPFQGLLGPTDNPQEGRLVGTIHLEPGETPSGVKGTFEGTLDGKPTTLKLGGFRFEIDRRVKAGFRRRLECSIDDEGAIAGPSRWIIGFVPRSFIDAYGSPIDPAQLQELYDRLGKVYEMALVFTWIAGLLNFLAIWDCVCGPAYGFGDEPVLAKDPASEGKTVVAAAPAASAPVGGEKDSATRSESRPAKTAP